MNRDEHMIMGFFIAILVLLAIVEMLFLHRIIGPIYRIEMVLEEILRANNYTKSIKIRKNDHLHSLVDKINALLARCREK